jgi:hypothetical protein
MSLRGLKAVKHFTKCLGLKEEEGRSSNFTIEFK